MSDGMSEYWKAKKLRDQEMRDESVARQAREAVARFVGRPDLVRRKKNPILMMNGHVVGIADIQGDILDLSGIKPIEVLGRFEVEEIVPMEISMTRYTKKESDEE